jgi:hypothetical protein
MAPRTPHRLVIQHVLNGSAHKRRGYNYFCDPHTVSFNNCFSSCASSYIALVKWIRSRRKRNIHDVCRHTLICVSNQQKGFYQTFPSLQTFYGYASRECNGVLHSDFCGRWRLRRLKTSLLCDT